MSSIEDQVASLNEEQLLTKAAILLGYEVESFSPHGLSVYKPKVGTRNNRFVPTQNNDEAFELAIEYGLRVQNMPALGFVVVDDGLDVNKIRVYKHYDDKFYAAEYARRAIVEALILKLVRR